ncbi:MAG: hypothetical protein AAF433_00605 [Bacteroidota bacterium]
MFNRTIPPMNISNLGRMAFLIFLILSVVSLFLLPQIGQII